MTGLLVQVIAVVTHTMLRKCRRSQQCRIEDVETRTQHVDRKSASSGILRERLKESFVMKRVESDRDWVDVIRR